ncbi:hypothetical protein TcCL_NonESM08644 [Trypanosoma cruzi]|nr:hypothetical protein TcCL_NonESM08644 [Trypanosoma cruzi]
MTLSCSATWIAVLLRVLCGGLLFSMSLPFCVWEGCGRGCVWESECGWLPASPRALGPSIHVALLDGVSRHPGRGEDEDEEDLLWAEGGWTGQSPSVSFPVSLAVHTESVNLSECGMKRLCRFVCATQSSSLQAVVTVRCSAVPFDEGRARCHGRCVPRPFISSAPALSFFSVCVNFFFFCFTMDLLEVLWFWWLLHDASPCVSVAVLPRDAEAFDGVFILLFESSSQPCLVMAAEMGFCGCVLVARVATHAVAASLCVGGGVGERRRWWSCAPVGEGRNRPHDRRGPLSPVSGCRHRTTLFVLLVCAVCAYGTAVCCAMPTHVREERRLDCR